MRVNNNCIKDVLNYIINTVTVNFSTANSEYVGISLLSIIKSLSEEKQYSEAEVLHSYIYAQNCGYIWASKRIEFKQIIPAKIDVYDVTPSGYAFIESNQC